MINISTKVNNAYHFINNNKDKDPNEVMVVKQKSKKTWIQKLY